MRLLVSLPLLVFLCLPIAGCATGPSLRPAAAGSHGTAAPRDALPFIDDDYPRALAEARARKLPIFVDTSAPWCHTCRFMRAYVFSDAALAQHAGRFVWLAIDTEKDVNAAFVARYPIAVWPTLMVLDAAAEKAVLKWPGSANVGELETLFSDGEAAVQTAARPQGAEGPEGPKGPKGTKELERTPAEAALTEADRLAAEGQVGPARLAYRAALASATPARRPRIVESLVLMLLAGHAYEQCAIEARMETPVLPRAAPFANAVAAGLTCAELAPIEAAWRAETIAALEPLCLEAVAISDLLADDRAGIFEALVEARADAGDEKGARTLSLRWLAFLDEEQARAPSDEARASLDPMVVEAATKAGVPERAIPALERSERAIPGDYNAPARLALVYRELGRWDEALAASDRALARVYGPRRIRLLENRAAVLESKGDAAAARQALASALEHAERLPAGGFRDAATARLRARLAPK